MQVTIALDLNLLSRRKTHTEYVLELESKNIPYVPVEQYETAIKLINHKCNHGHVWKVSPNKILQGRGCPKCIGLKTSIRCKKSTEEYILQLPINITCLQEYKGAHIPITHKCWKSFDKASDAYAEEQRLLKELINKRVTDIDFLKSGGGTELFKEDVLQLHQ